MAANTLPISPIAPAISWNGAPLTAANTAMDGTGTVATIFTAGANGSRVGRLRVVHRGTNVATVMRFFVNNGSSNATPGNNDLIAEITVAANTLSQVAASIFQDVNINCVLKQGYKLNYTIGTAVAAGHSVDAIDAGDY